MMCRVPFVLFFVAVQLILGGVAMHYTGGDGSNSGGTAQPAGAGSADPGVVGAPGTIGSRGTFRSPLVRINPRAQGSGAGVEQVTGQSDGLTTGAVISGFNTSPETVTVNSYVTLTDLALHTEPVTLTQFVVHTTTRRIEQVVTTPVDDRVAISTSVVVRPAFVTVTETKSDFRLVTITSLTQVTQTFTSYDIKHVTFTTTATQVVSITSAMVRTVVTTHRDTVTSFHTILNTAYVHGGYP